MVNDGMELVWNVKCGPMVEMDLCGDPREYGMDIQTENDDDACMGTEAIQPDIRKGKITDFFVMDPNFKGMGMDHNADWIGGE